jgi:putative endonuclease
VSKNEAAAHFVYIVRCADGTLYTGYARDPRRREMVHNRGQGAKYTAGRRPVTLVYSERFTSRGDALKREHQLKGWPRARKELLAWTIPSPGKDHPVTEKRKTREKSRKIEPNDWQSCCE